VIVSLSESAKLSSAQTADQTFKDVGMSARPKLDGLIQQAARKANIPASQVNVQEFGLIDFSSFSDQELAAMNLNSSGNFSKTEQDHANGVLAGRMSVSLEPCSLQTQLGDFRGEGMAINALYDKMTPEVRQALSWTPAMMASNNQMLSNDSRRLGNLDNNTIIANLRYAQHHGGLTFDDRSSSAGTANYSFLASITGASTTTAGLFENQG
jgi:hypothetical protein